VVVSGVINPIAKVEAISKFEGPANGIKLKPKAVRKKITNSIIATILTAHLLSKKLGRFELISASLKMLKTREK